MIIPWRMYQRYGDRDALQHHYAGMVRWMDFIESRNPDYVRNDGVHSNWGDWLCLGQFTPKNVVATAYWAYLADIMAKVAKLLGRRQDEARFRAMFRDVRHAFQKAFVSSDGRIEGDTQTAYLFALDFNLLPEDQRERAFARLLRTFDAADDHMQTGIHGIRHVCPVLSEGGAVEKAYDLLLKDSYPSWGFSIRNGATTIWERWDGWTPENGFQSVNMNSLNHYALGAIGEWLFARVAGIDLDEAGPGFRRIRLRPLPTSRLGWCRASYDSHFGRIASEWTCGAEKVEWKVTVPPNCAALVTLPAHLSDIHIDGGSPKDIAIAPTRLDGGGVSFEIGSGDYSFVIAVSPG